MEVKPTQEPELEEQVIPGVYGVCANCGDTCYVTWNRRRYHRRQQIWLKTVGERGQYWAIRHLYYDREKKKIIAIRCHGSHAIPAKIFKNGDST